MPTLSEEAGPLPVWAWLGLGTAGLAGYLIYRKNKSMNQQANQTTNQASGTSSNLGTVPISNLTVAAEPMPIQMGDTFVNVPPPNVTQTVGPTTVNPPNVNVPVQVTAPAPVVNQQQTQTVNNPPQPNPNPAPPQPPAASLAPAPKPAAPPPPKPQKTVTVCSYPNWCGSLWGIAEKEYGNGTLWPRIYQANKALIGANPNLIHPGQVLVIP